MIKVGSTSGCAAAKLIKPLLVGLVALGAFIKKIFKAIFGGNEQKVEDPMKNAAGQG